MRKSILLSVLTLALVSSLATVVYAPEQTLSTGYAITSNYHGIDLPLWSEVVVTAMTTDASVYTVTFRWHNPADQPVWTDAVPVYSNGTTYNGMLIYYANSTHSPNVIGDWGVQAFFQDPDGRTKSGITDVIKIKATSFNVIPEVPVVGTAGASAAMLLGVTYKLIRKPKNK